MVRFEPRGSLLLGILELVEGSWDLVVVLIVLSVGMGVFEFRLRAAGVILSAKTRDELLSCEAASVMSELTGSISDLLKWNLLCCSTTVFSSLEIVSSVIVERSTLVVSL